MTTTAGSECYNCDCAPVMARGTVYSDRELTDALNGPVSAIVRDDGGSEAIEDLLLGISETGFQQDSVKRILSHTRVPEDWRVGEALAESYLVDHKGCSFPWPAGRDQKNPESSPAGADLVGFQRVKQKQRPHRFAFGEVKTSSEDEHPPQVMTGRHGLARQIEALRDDAAVKDHLVKYLGHRAPGSAWQEKYNAAAAIYLADDTDVSLFGVLIRDVPPDPADLRARAGSLAKDCPTQTKIELGAIYLPEGSIKRIGRRVVLRKEGRHAGN